MRVCVYTWKSYLLSHYQSLNSFFKEQFSRSLQKLVLSIL